jgi:hypothetical protein
MNAAFAFLTTPGISRSPGYFGCLCSAVFAFSSAPLSFSVVATCPGL